MALPSKYGIDKKINSMEGLSAFENGGKGSGNFGHSGRPGEVGGSGDGNGSLVEEKMEILFDVPDKFGSIVQDFLKSDEYRKKYSELKEIKSQEKEKEKEKDTAKENLKTAKKSLDTVDGRPLYGEEYKKVREAKEKGVREYVATRGRRQEVEEQLADLVKTKIEKSSKGAKVDVSIGRAISGGSEGKKLTIVVKEKEKNSCLEETHKAVNGGKGSGNFGHVGRPGLIGGSGGGDAPAGEWDEPYKSFTKTDQIGVGDYGEAGFFTTGNFAVDAHLGAKDIVDSVKDYNIINDMLFEAETKDHLASTPEGIQVERLITDLKGELHAQNVYSSATFETSEIRQKILLQTAASASSIRSKLESARGVDSHNRYIDKAIDIAKKVERRALTAAKKSYDKWETHKTAKPQVAGGTLTAGQDRQMTHAYDNYKLEKQRKRASDLAYMFSR